MEYMLSIYETEHDFQRRNNPEDTEYWAGWQAFTHALETSGALASGNALDAPDTSTTVRLSQGTSQIHDGPFADSVEQLAGYYIIDVENLDIALQWAARAPNAATGAVEVRPVLKM